MVILYLEYLCCHFKAMEPNYQKLILITSPPATGKTYWIYDFWKKSEQAEILVISPLRALADECKSRWPKNINVMTPEEWIKDKKHFDVVIIDEFHLLFYWGDSFRPVMWEVFFTISFASKIVFGLTATLSKEMISDVKAFPHFDEKIWIDCGNQKLKFRPRRYLKIPSKNLLLKDIFNKRKGTSLVFCKYREEVLELEKKLVEKKYSCISCIGGEASRMKAKLERTPAPDFIISTTVLSHGVNLPEISQIYFLYELKNLDFWIQMVARGGRKGEIFDVYSLENAYFSDWKSWKNLIWYLEFFLRRKFSGRGPFFV